MISRPELDISTTVVLGAAKLWRTTGGPEECCANPTAAADAATLPDDNKPGGFRHRRSAVRSGGHSGTFSIGMSDDGIAPANEAGSVVREALAAAAVEALAATLAMVGPPRAAVECCC